VKLATKTLPKEKTEWKNGGPEATFTEKRGDVFCQWGGVSQNRGLQGKPAKPEGRAQKKNPRGAFPQERKVRRTPKTVVWGEKKKKNSQKSWGKYKVHAQVEKGGLISTIIQLGGFI